MCLHSTWDLTFITIFFIFHVTFGYIKILCMHFHRFVRLHYSVLLQVRKGNYFAASTGVTTWIKQARRRIRVAKGRHKCWKLLIKAFSLTAVFVTTNNPTVFQDAQDFEISSISAVIDNCAAATVSNDKSLFVGKLTPTKGHIIVTVRDSENRPTYYGPGEFSTRDDNGTIVFIPIPKELHFTTSPVNAIRIGEISLQNGNEWCDEETFIKSTRNKCWFSWNHGQHHQNMLHAVSGLLELITDEANLELKSVAWFNRAKDFICNFAPSCDTYSNLVLLKTPTNDELPESIDEHNEFIKLQDNEGLWG